MRRTYVDGEDFFVGAVEAFHQRVPRYFVTGDQAAKDKIFRLPDEGRIVIFPLDEVPGYWFYNVILNLIVFPNGCINFACWVLLICLEIAGINVFGFADLQEI